jgi:8-oxo-dGTP pyrophosphatase MutT (NUDIX family)
MLPSYELTALAARLARGEATEDAGASGRQAAVAAVLRAPPDGGDAEILLMRRAERHGDPWSGHMAFPGGRREEGDATLLDTAIREAREEVGLDLRAHGTLLARLPDIQAV